MSFTTCLLFAVDRHIFFIYFFLLRLMMSQLWREEQYKRMEKQTKTIAERFASEIAALREALEKNM